jgi:hypothetical protein
MSSYPGVVFLNGLPGLISRQELTAVNSLPIDHKNGSCEPSLRGLLSGRLTGEGPRGALCYDRLQYPGSYWLITFPLPSNPHHSRKIEIV